MPLSLLDIPPEVLQHIAFLTTLGSPLGPPKELISCMLTCRALNRVLLPENAGELYHLIFAQKFDITAPQYRLGTEVVREHAHAEMRRRFLAIRVFKSRSRELQYSDAALSDAFWIAYVMVEDADTSQKNVKQLLRAGLPAFLDRYLRERLYHPEYASIPKDVEDASDERLWPLINETSSLAIALAWTLASQVVLRSESSELRQTMINLLAPIVFSTKYSVCRVHRNDFSLGPDASSANTQYHTGTFPPTDIAYFGTVRRKARVPSATIFATLLYFARTEITNSMIAMPKHPMPKTREEANATGRRLPSREDILHFARHCGTRFADFPGIDVGILSSTLTGSPDVVLCQPAVYRLGTLSGSWHGSVLYPQMRPDYILAHLVTKMPLYIALEEHYTCNPAAAVPVNTDGGCLRAWLPEGLEGDQTSHGMQFSFTENERTLSTIYETFHPNQPAHIMRGKKIVDVIITGKASCTEDQYIAAWGGQRRILGRVRLHDGLMTLHRFNEDENRSRKEFQLLQGYVTSSQNLAGRILHSWLSDDNKHYEGVFSLSKNYTGLSTPRNNMHMY